MPEEITGIEVGINTTTIPKPRSEIYNPFPDDRRESFSPEEKFKRWIKEQGEKDKRAAELMRTSKKQRKIRIA